MENKLFVAVLVCFFSVAVRAAESPNIVLIVADDMGWNEVAIFLVFDFTFHFPDEFFAFFILKQKI